jgi:hypothetical protein
MFEKGSKLALAAFFLLSGTGCGSCGDSQSQGGGGGSATTQAPVTSGSGGVRPRAIRPHLLRELGLIDGAAPADAGATTD